MKPFHRLYKLAFAALVLALDAGCSDSRSYPSRPITLVCPWAAGGGTDRVSRQIAEYLSVELGVPVHVINATGGKGVTGHSRGLTATPDGYTVTMITLELNMMHWSGLTDLTYADCEPLMSVNEDYCALFVRSDAPWQSLAELEQDIRESPGSLRASGTSSGGAWHLALAGWLLAAGMESDDVVWISSTGAAPSLQGLMSNSWDMVACSLPEATTLLRSGQVRTLGVMAPRPVESFPEVATFIQQGTDWTLGGWRGLAVPNNTPPPVIDTLTAAIHRIVTGQTKLAGTTFPRFMQAQGFDHTWRAPEDFRQFMKETDAKLGRLLTSEAMRSVNTDRFNPMMFPNLLLILLGLTSVSLVAQHLYRGRQSGGESRPAVRPPRRGVLNFCAFVGAVVVYLQLAEVMGFVLLAGVIMFCLLSLLGTRIWLSGLMTVLLVPAVYQLFSHALRVPLPRGWLGW